MKFHTPYQIRVSDLNYGNHVGHDHWVSILHHARCVFLREHGLSEIQLTHNDDQNLAPKGDQSLGLIVKSLQVQYKRQGLLWDEIDISLWFLDAKMCSVNMLYEIHQTTPEKKLMVFSTVELVCFDYKAGKVAAFPTTFKTLMEEYS